MDFIYVLETDVDHYSGDRIFNTYLFEKQEDARTYLENLKYAYIAELMSCYGITEQELMDDYLEVTNDTPSNVFMFIDDDIYISLSIIKKNILRFNNF